MSEHTGLAWRRREAPGCSRIVCEQFELINRVVEFAIMQLIGWNGGEYLKRLFVLLPNFSRREKFLAGAVGRGAWRQG